MIRAKHIQTKLGNEGFYCFDITTNKEVKGEKLLRIVKKLMETMKKPNPL